VLRGCFPGFPGRIVGKQRTLKYYVYGDSTAGQIGCEHWQAIKLILRPAVFDGDVPPLDIAEFVQSAAADDAVIKIAVRRIGLALVFARLWEETGCRAVIADLAAKRGHKFALERAVFLTVLHRLLVSGSDRAADRWREDYAIAGGDGLDLHHLYRAMAWLGEELPEPEQDGRTPFAPRCLKDVVEERLFAHRRELLTRLDLVFMDTTSLYFEGAGGQTLGQHGYSKDHRPDLRQMILAVLIDGDGRPVCSETWPGNTADVTTREGQLSTIPCVNRSVATIASYTSSVIITPSS
jgi:hypothetical protein